jgi:hypothetical protein
VCGEPTHRARIITVSVRLAQPFDGRRLLPRATPGPVAEAEEPAGREVADLRAAVDDRLRIAATHRLVSCPCSRHVHGVAIAQLTRGSPAVTFKITLTRSSSSPAVSLPGPAPAYAGRGAAGRGLAHELRGRLVGLVSVLLGNAELPRSTYNPGDSAEQRQVQANGRGAAHGHDAD